MSWKHAAIFTAFLLPSCSSIHTYDFLVTNRDCHCSKYSIDDKNNHITYIFTANYGLRDEMLTTITMRVENRSRKTLSFDHARVRISSKRFGYQYNDKFIPFDPMKIKPGRDENLTLIGRAEVKERPEWRQIAGEEMILTVHGIRLGEEEVNLEDIHFVPVNPKLTDD